MTEAIGRRRTDSRVGGSWSQDDPGERRSGTGAGYQHCFELCGEQDWVVPSVRPRAVAVAYRSVERAPRLGTTDIRISGHFRYLSWRSKTARRHLIGAGSTA